MLEQIRNQLREQQAKISNDPNVDDKYRDFIEKATAFFDLEDAVALLSTPQIMAVAHLLGHSVEESKEIALKIEKEVHKTYKMINID